MTLKFKFFENLNLRILEDQLEIFCRDDNITKSNLIKIYNHSVIIPANRIGGVEEDDNLVIVNKVMLVWNDEE